MTLQSYFADLAGLEGVDLFGCLGKQRTLGLLQSLRKFQGEHPEVFVVVKPPSR